MTPVRPLNTPELFQVHRLNARGMEKAHELQVAFLSLEGLISAMVGDGPESARCLALARTKREEACFYAKKAMAQAPANAQEVP